MIVTWDSVQNMVMRATWQLKSAFTKMFKSEKNTSTFLWISEHLLRWETMMPKMLGGGWIKVKNECIFYTKLDYWFLTFVEN